MYQTITFSTFCDAFHSHGRDNQFTYEGKRHLFNYLEQYEEDCDTRVELDVIGLCCEYSEETLNEVLEYYRLESLDELQDRTCVINYDDKTGLVLYQVF